MKIQTEKLVLSHSSLIKEGDNNEGMHNVE
jgi:hypothetical protein